MLNQAADMTLARSLNASRHRTVWRRRILCRRTPPSTTRHSCSLWRSPGAGGLGPLSCGWPGGAPLWEVQCPVSPPGRRGRERYGCPGALLQSWATRNLHVASVSGARSCWRKHNQWAHVCSRPSLELAWATGGRHTHLSWEPPAYMLWEGSQKMIQERLRESSSNSAQRTLTQNILLRPPYCL